MFQLINAMSRIKSAQQHGTIRELHSRLCCANECTGEVGSAQSTHLIVGPESSLPGEGSGGSGSVGGSANTVVGGTGQFEGVAVGGETNQQLLSGGTLALPVVHGVVLIMAQESGVRVSLMC